jgi:hypothetical protein
MVLASPGPLLTPPPTPFFLPPEDPSQVHRYPPHIFHPLAAPTQTLQNPRAQILRPENRRPRSCAERVVKRGYHKEGGKPRTQHLGH